MCLENKVFAVFQEAIFLTGARWGFHQPQALHILIVRCSSLSFQSMTLKEAIKSSLTILKQVMEEKLNATNIEVSHFLQS